MDSRWAPLSRTLIPTPNTRSAVWTKDGRCAYSNTPNQQNRRLISTNCAAHFKRGGWAVHPAVVSGKNIFGS